MNTIKQLENKTGQKFYIPLLKEDTWQIFSYINGVKEIIGIHIQKIFLLYNSFVMKNFCFDFVNTLLFIFFICALILTSCFTVFNNINAHLFSCLVSICTSISTACGIPAWMRYLDYKKADKLKKSFVSKICYTQDKLLGNILCLCCSNIDINSMGPNYNSLENMAYINLNLGKYRNKEVEINKIKDYLQDKNLNFNDILNNVYNQFKNNLKKVVIQIEDNQYYLQQFILSENELNLIKKQITNELVIFEKVNPKSLNTVEQIVSINKQIRDIINWDKKIKIEFMNFEQI